MTANLRISAALTLIAVSTLMLELLLMRVFDVILSANMAYLVITCAMFAFGLAGIFATLRPQQPGSDVRAFVANLSIGFGVFTLMLLPALNWLPFDYGKINEEPLTQIFFFGLMYLALTIPFFLSGLIFTTVFSAFSSQIRTLYFFDLCGAAIGCVFFIPLIPEIGPGGLMFVGAAICLVAASLFMGAGRFFPKALAATAVILVCIPFLRADGYFDFREHEDKRGIREARQQGDVELSLWDPIAKIDVVKSYGVDENTGERKVVNRHVAYDGGSQSSRLYPFDGDFTALRTMLWDEPNETVKHFWNRGVVASHWLREDSDSEVLIIGSAAGQETKGALMFNAKHIDAIEMVRAVVELSLDDYGDYIGNIFSDPRVDVRVGEGRTFLRSGDREYDIIQIFSNHTTSSMAQGGGATRAIYLQTVEAYTEYFSSLKEDGILHINHHVYPRMVATAAVAWKRLGKSDFGRHVIVYERPGQDNIPLVMFKMTPWSVDEVQRLNRFMLRPGIDDRDTFSLVENPLQPGSGFLSESFYDASLTQAQLDAIPYHVSPSTDDQPFFGFLRKELSVMEVQPEKFVNVSVAELLNSQRHTTGIPLDLAHYFITAAAALFFSVVFIFVPLFFSGVGRARWAGEFSSLFYFSCLGAGFIIAELTFMKIFMKLIGYPLHTYSTVLFTMLFAAGLGSLSAKKLEITPQNRWSWPFLGTVIFGLALWLVHPFVFDKFLAADTAFRILCAALLMFPMSFFMGMALPLGILAIEKKPNGAVAWAWGMNGLFTTVGGIGAGLLAIYLGFKMTVLLALLIYVLAGLTFRRLARLSAQTA